jgi:ComF family protein
LCIRTPPPHTRTVAAVDYGFPWAGMIGRFKFNGQPELARALAPLLADAVVAAGAAPVSLLLPVPLSNGRLAERGYNQAWELARRLARPIGLPPRDDLLLRVRDTPHQVGLSRAQRLRNLRDAFWVPPPAQAQLQGRAVAVVDDVMTTGVTAAAASLALLAAGAASVQLWVLARTPAPDEAAA